ncbi:MAG TPA: TIGR02301 family protein [Hyphomicrobiales bacterium]|nr:TIGR02301 family protein [Hyphomicrobiales bacterium]
MTLRALVTLACVLAVCAAALQSGPTFGQSRTASTNFRDPDAKPYDAQLFQLSEILGTVHYLRELCGADEGQMWRGKMRQLVGSEGTSALRRARLVDSFNKGYRGYAQTYRTCTRPALQAINRFMIQGARLADTLIENNR